MLMVTTTKGEKLYAYVYSKKAHERYNFPPLGNDQMRNASNITSHLYHA